MSDSQAVQVPGHHSVSESSGGQLPAWVSWTAWAGIIGPMLFTAAFLAQEAFRRGEYDPLAEPVSALEAGPYGWIQRLNFVMLSLLTIRCNRSAPWPAGDASGNRRAGAALRQRYRLAMGRR